MPRAWDNPKPNMRTMAGILAEDCSFLDDGYPFDPKFYRRTDFDHKGNRHDKPKSKKSCIGRAPPRLPTAFIRRLKSAAAYARSGSKAEEALAVAASKADSVGSIGGAGSTSPKLYDDITRTLDGLEHTPNTAANRANTLTASLTHRYVHVRGSRQCHIASAA